MFDYISVESEEEYTQAAKLFKEYAAWLKIDLSFQSFEKELITLKTMYASPKGTIILCKKETEYIASIAVRPLKNNIAELKRMFVKPAFHHNGIGQTLLSKSIEFAKAAGYETIRLDTLDNMIPAIQLYLKNGFYTIPPYYHNPEPSALYFEKSL